MTGRYNIRYGFASGVLKPAKPYGLPTNETILPQYLNELGFESHMVRELLLSKLRVFRSNTQLTRRLYCKMDNRLGSGKVDLVAWVYLPLPMMIALLVHVDATLGDAGT